MTERDARPRPVKAAFFDRDAASPVDVTVPLNLSLPETLRAVDLDAPWAGKLQARFLLDIEAETGGYFFVEMTGAPGTRLPRHKHNWDQIVLVLEGSLVQGARVVTAGSGYFTAADQPYGLTVGPEGARWVEFHTRSRRRGTTEIVEGTEFWNAADPPPA